MAAGDTQVAQIVTDLQNMQTHCTALVAAMSGDGSAAFARSLEAATTASSSLVHVKAARKILRLMCAGQAYDDAAEEYPR
jgi:hypothetical protein